MKVNAEGYDTGQTLSTEVFDDPEEMESLDVVMYKEEPMPEPVPAPTGMVQGVENQPFGIINITEEIEEEMLIPEEKPEETKTGSKTGRSKTGRSKTGSQTGTKTKNS